jgi:hypothetical protein
MKSLKAAAVVAGSLALAGAAAPASAQDTADLTPMSLNGAVNTLTNNPLGSSPLQHSNALDTENKHSVLNAVNGVTRALNSAGGPAQLLGGLPLKG